MSIIKRSRAEETHSTRTATLLAPSKLLSEAPVVIIQKMMNYLDGGYVYYDDLRGVPFDGGSGLYPSSSYAPLFFINKDLRLIAMRQLCTLKPVIIVTGFSSELTYWNGSIILPIRSFTGGKINRTLHIVMDIRSRWHNIFNVIMLLGGSLVATSSVVCVNITRRILNVAEPFASPRIALNDVPWASPDSDTDDDDADDDDNSWDENVYQTLLPQQEGLLTVDKKNLMDIFESFYILRDISLRDELSPRSHYRQYMASRVSLGIAMASVQHAITLSPSTRIITNNHIAATRLDSLCRCGGTIVAPWFSIKCDSIECTNHQSSCYDCILDFVLDRHRRFATLCHCGKWVHHGCRTRASASHCIKFELCDQVGAPSATSANDSKMYGADNLCRDCLLQVSLKGACPTHPVVCYMCDNLIHKDRVSAEGSYGRVICDSGEASTFVCHICMRG